VIARGQVLERFSSARASGESVIWIAGVVT